MILKIKNCPRCKKEFKCCDGNCWCEKLNISNEKLKIMRMNYNSCLCPDCLKLFANSKKL